MQYLLRSGIALLAALAVATVPLVLVDSPPTGWLMYSMVVFFSLLLYGWGLYIPFLALHYWLLRPAPVPSTLRSVLLGAGVAVLLWALATWGQQLPPLMGHAWRTMLLFASTGALYGFVYKSLPHRSRS